MEYSISLFIESLVNSSNWFILYLIVYGFVGLFLIGGILLALLGMMPENEVSLFIAAACLLALTFPNPKSPLFDFIDPHVKGKYVEPIKSYLHKDNLEKISYRDISDLIKYQYNDKDDFYLKFINTLSTKIPKDVKFSNGDLSEELYSEYKKCFTNKSKPNDVKRMSIEEIRQEIQNDKITCVRYSASLFEDPKRIEQFIKKM